MNKTIKKSNKSSNSAIKNASELTLFIGKSLPWMKDTGKAKHLRKIESDVKSKGKAVIIWYGCSNSNAITKLHVTVNLKVRSHGFVADPNVVSDTENELKIAFACRNQEQNQVVQVVQVKEQVEVVEAVEVEAL